ncbi:MAG: hypothetical protein GEV10_17195 [Streptosporangiales bacterium]|nr:hypothetical protein [Streptosporangiales bacterium]
MTDLGYVPPPEGTHHRRSALAGYALIGLLLGSVLSYNARTSNDPPDECDDVIASYDVEALMRTRSEVTPTEEESGASLTCRWQSAGAGDDETPRRATLSVTVARNWWFGAGEAVDRVRDGGVEGHRLTLDGVGDEAVVDAGRAVDGRWATEVGVREGGTSIHVSYVVDGDDGPTAAYVGELAARLCLQENVL